MEDPIGASDNGCDSIIVAKIQLVDGDLIGNFFEIVKFSCRKIVYDMDVMALGK